MKADDQLKIVVEDGLLSISIGVDLLAFAINHCSPEFDSLEITDTTNFAKDIVTVLQYEAEDGTTPVHRMFDQAAEKAANDGSEYVADAPPEPEDKG